MGVKIDFLWTYCAILSFRTEMKDIFKAHLRLSCPSAPGLRTYLWLSCVILFFTTQMKAISWVHLHLLSFRTEMKDIFKTHLRLFGALQ